MKITDEMLLNSGFSESDIRKLQNNIAHHGGTFDSVTHDLANRFIATKWISIVALAIFVIALMMTSRDTIITLAATLAIVVPFIWYLAPARLAYKAWKFTRRCYI